MLTHLQINNFVLIKSFKNEFNSGFTTITGETGSGKSLFIKAIEYVTGKRLDIDTEKNIKGKADIVATFDISNNNKIKSYLEDKDLYTDESCILRRVIHQDGKNNAYINNVKVPLKELSELSKELVEIHSQNSNLNNINEDKHTSILDSYVDNNIKDYQNNLYTLYQEYKQYQNELKLLQKENENNLSNYQLLEYKYNEIKDLNIKENEYQELESELSDLENAEKYISNSMKIKELISGSFDDSTFDLSGILKTIQENINTLNPDREGVKSLQTMLDDIYAISSEMQSTADNESSSFEIDDERLVYVRERISEINLFSKKNNVLPEEIYDYSLSIIEEFEKTKEPTNNIDHLEEKISELKKEWYIEAEKVSKIRAENIKLFEGIINKSLKELKMNDSDFKVKKQDVSYEVNPYGLEKIIFEIRPNLGQEYQEIKTLSGGESARFNLAIKASISKNQLKTLIFDEIDTGTAGITANSIGKYMYEISKHNQVIAITHLHQVALYSDNCFTVNKNPKNSEKITNIIIEKLTDNDFVIELSRMFGYEYTNNQRVKEIKKLIEETKK